MFTTLVFKDKDFTENIIYEKLLNDRLSVNLGYLYEMWLRRCLPQTVMNFLLYFSKRKDKA